MIVIDINKQLAEFSNSISDFSENNATQLKKSAVSFLEVQLQNANREILDLKKRLISPEVSYESLLGEAKIKALTAPCDSGYDLQTTVGHFFQQDNRDKILEKGLIDNLTIIAESLIEPLNEDTLWYFSEFCIEKDTEKNISIVSDIVKKLIQKAVDEVSEKNTLKNFENLKEMTLTFVQSNNIDQETIYNWITKKLHEAPTLDRLTSNILSNMIDTIIDELPVGNMDNIFEKELFNYENHEFIPQEFKNKGSIKKSDRQEVVVGTLKLFLLCNIKAEHQS